MDSFVNEQDFALLAQDRYTFSVLDRILREPCELIRTNHWDLILCHSEKPYPVWIWTPDGCSGQVKEEAWELAAWLRPFSSGHRFNMKHELADYFVKRAGHENMNIGISMELFSYDCPDPIPPDCPADGAPHCCPPEDLDTAVSLMAAFYPEIGEEPPEKARIAEKAQAYISRRALFFWKNDRGTAVSCCSFRANEGLACLGSVFTLPAYRRRHYAQHLVYRVTETVRSLGFLPMLYTDAGYPASNACYEKIGYVLRGRLCTVAALNREG